MNSMKNTTKNTTEKSMHERCEAVIPKAAGRSTTLGVVNSEGCYVYTEDGRKVLDFASGVAVCNLGHRHPKVVEAAKNQMDTMIHVGHNVVYYESYVKLAERLVELTGGDTMVYFSNSGAEANEGAMKLAKYTTGRPAIIAFQNSFHGRTLACASVTASNAKYRKNYEPLLPAVYFAQYPKVKSDATDLEKKEAVKQALDSVHNLFEKLVDPEMVAAIMVEPVQGEGGYIIPPAEFLQGLRKLCDEHGILLLFDEVQSGMGRTGQLFAYQTLGVRPDILTSAKAIASGFPLSAVIAKREIMERWPSGAHGGTFGGNPVSCAAGLATLEAITQEGFLENSRKMGQYFLEGLHQLQTKYPQIIYDVRGLGLMIAMEIASPDGAPDAAKTDEIQRKALEQNVMLLTCGSDHNVVRFIAPLIVTETEIDLALKVMDSVLSEM